MTMLTASARTFADRAKSPGSIASSAAVLVAGLAAFPRDKPLDGAGKPFGLGSVLKGAALVSTLWLAFRSQARHQEDK